MNISQKIALDCGVKISEPSIDLAFYPINHEKYIIIDNRHQNVFDVYDHFEDVIKSIQPFLNQNGIATYFFTNENAPQINCHRAFININKKQEAYLISKSLLVICNDNYSSYIASILNKKCITLYSNYTAKSKAPIWNKNSQIIFESDRQGNKPSYNSLAEKPKAINLIDPFKISKSILDNLNIKNNIDDYDLVYLGERYQDKVLEIIPDFIPPQDYLTNQVINLRLDYVSDLDAKVLLAWAANRRINIITNRDLHTAFLKRIIQNVSTITVILSDSVSNEFLKFCKSLGREPRLYCSEKNKFNDFKFKFLDWNVIKDFKDENEISSIKNLNSESKFVSSKILISKGKSYACKSAYLRKIPLDNQSQKVIFSDLLNEEIDYFKIYNEKERKDFAIRTS